MKIEQAANKLRNKGLFALRRLSYDASYDRRLRELREFTSAGFSSGSDSLSDVIVSLTSYGDRLQKVHLAIVSLLDQTVRPNRVILYLDDETSPHEIPAELDLLQNHGLEIRRGVENMKGHKKYYYAMHEFPDNPIVTIDDDLVYPRNTIEQLMVESRKSPGCVIARRTHAITFDRNGAIAPYKEWLYEYRGHRRKSNRLFLTSGGGTLFPSSIFPQDCLDAAAINSCAPASDDVWLSFSLRRASIPIIRARCDLNLFWVIEGTQDDGLQVENVAGGGNDVAVFKTLEFMDLSSKDFCD